MAGAIPKKIWIPAIAVIVIVGIGTAAVAYKAISSNSSMSMDHSGMSMNDTSSSYNVNLMSGTSYNSNQSTTLKFAVEQNGKVFKSFGIDSTKLMHLIVVRKDRDYFQHVHPTYDAKTGVFTMDNFQFPTDGRYRVYANFAPTNASKDAMGMIETAVPYVDVNVGNATTASTPTLGRDSLTSTADGLTATLGYAPSGDGPSMGATPKYYAGVDGSVGINIAKDGVPFTNLQEYLGNLGHMVILGPNLEFIHAHPNMSDLSKQTGYIPFMVTFPRSGQYKIYLQTQANATVSTFNFNVTVLDMPKSSSSNSGSSMQGMNMGN